MANNNTKDNVGVGKPKINGQIFRAPSGTSLPTDATTALASAFENLGHISTDGLVNSFKRTSTEIKSWDGAVVAVPQTDYSDTFKYTMIEAFNAEVLKTVYGDNKVTGTISTGLAVAVSPDEDVEHVYVAELEPAPNVKKRIVIPAGKVTEVGDISYKRDNVIGYPVTITCLGDSSGNSHYEYIRDITTTSTVTT